MTAGTYEYLGFPFAVDVAHPGLRERFEALFEPCRSDATPKHTFAIDVIAEGRMGVTVDGACGRTTNDPSFALAHLLWEINRRAVCEPSDALVVHGGAVARDGVAVLCTAPSGHGKSTLVAALLRAGFDYLTDDAVALDLASGVAAPAPKPVALGPDVVSMFGLPADPYGGVERFATAQDLGARVASATPVGVVVFPHYKPGEPLGVRDVSRASALLGVAEESFNFHLLKERALYGLAEAVRTCHCLEISYADARDAAREIADVVSS